MHKFTQSSSLIHRSTHRNTKYPYNTVFVNCSKGGCLLSKEIDFLTLGEGGGIHTNGWVEDGSLSGTVGS